MTKEQKIIRAKVGLLELARQLGNVSQACKMMVTGTGAPPRLWRPAERDFAFRSAHARGANSMHQTRHDADSYQRVEVITGLRRRRDWSDAEKARILAESADPEVNISEVARRNGVSRGLLNVWRRKARHASSEGPQFVQVRLDWGASRLAETSGCGN